MENPSFGADTPYKRYHEEYLSDNNGTTAGEVFLAVAVVPPIAVLQSLLVFLSPKLMMNYNLGIRTFLFEFCIIVLPTIAAVTVLSSYLATLLTATILCCLVIMILLYLSAKKKPSSKAFDKSYQMKRRACVTYIRAVTNIITAICILAVDFKIFPQRFSKTETFGFSVMDVGVGLYVAINALVAPEARGIAKNLTLRHTCLNSIPLLVLGAVRLVATQMLNYQQHISEYGVHWNFFFTLGFTKIFSSFLVSMIPQLKWRLFVLVSLSVIFSYEICLHFGLNEWILGGTERSDFLSANREGVFSLFGYLSIYFAGLSLGQLLFKEKSFTLKKNLKFLATLVCVASVSWLVTYIGEKSVGVSRRLANLGYCLWIVTFVISTFCLALTGEILGHFMSILCKNTKEKLPVVPLLFEACNCHGLVFFLLANVLTGLVNLSIKTLYVGQIQSFLILSVYMLLCCGITCMYHAKNKCKRS